jgi:spore maturation protein B
MFQQIINTLSLWAIPMLFFIIAVFGFYKKVKIYESFVEGAKDGFNVAIRIIPYLVAILVAIGMFRASGAMDYFVMLLSPITNLIGMPAETLPVALMRPLSGSGSLGLATELIKTHGPDSFIGRLASVIYGSTETTFYVLAVYFGAVGIKRTRHALPAGLVADATGIVMAVVICRILFD